MTEMSPESPAGSCRPNGRDNPRILRDRHLDTCPGDCAGCQPCTKDHCRICKHTHANGTCGDCLTDIREHLTEIVQLCGDIEHKGGTTNPLLTEATQRRLDSEAMYLLAPTANPAAWQQRGTYGHRYHEDAQLGEHHPAWVLASWEMRVRAELNHTRAHKFDLTAAADYLNRNLTYLAGYQDLPFEDMADELRMCARHLASVLHDQDYGDRANVACFDCRGDLERKLGKDGLEDFWTCHQCGRRYTWPEYNFALRAALEEASRKADESA